MNKAIKLIDLPSMMRNKYVVSAIFAFFTCIKSPIICCKYNIHIRNNIEFP